MKLILLLFIIPLDFTSRDVKNEFSSKNIELINMFEGVDCEVYVKYDPYAKTSRCESYGDDKYLIVLNNKTLPTFGHELGHVLDHIKDGAIASHANCQDVSQASKKGSRYAMMFQRLTKE